MNFGPMVLRAASTLCIFAGAANATEIQFEGAAPPAGLLNLSPGAPYTEAGFTFTPANEQAAIFDAAYPGASFPGDSTSWLGFTAGNTITITGPSAFDLIMLDLGPSTLGSGTTDISIFADIFGGGTETTTFSGLTTDTTESMNWTGLQDVQITGDTDSAIDNVIVNPSSGTPEPGTMLLLAAGLGAVGFVRRRSSNV